MRGERFERFERSKDITGAQLSLVADEHLYKCIKCRSATLCKYFMHGACTRGSACPFSHDLHELPNTVSRRTAAVPQEYAMW